MNEVTVRQGTPAEAAAEAGMLARRAAAAYREMVECYKKSYKLSHQEAVARAEEPSPPEEQYRVEVGPPDQVSWLDLQRLGDRRPGRMTERWEEIKDYARGELLTGERAARAAEGFGAECWERAQFAAILNELIDGWQPRSGPERLLLDQMALAHSAFLCWMKTHAQRAALEALRMQRHLGDVEQQPRPRRQRRHSPGA
jgi:hypothetical protein